MFRIRYFLLAWKISIPNFPIRLSLCTAFIFGLPFALLGAVNVVFPDLNTKSKIIHATYIWIAIFVILTIIAYMRAMTILAQKKDPPTEDHHYLQSLDAKFYGVSRKIVHVESQLLKEGRVESKHSIELVAKADKIYSVEHHMIMPHAPKGTSNLPQLDVETKENDKIKLKPVKITEGSHRLFWKLNFLPCLPKDKKVHYSYNEKSTEGSFAMSYEEMKKRDMEYEFCSMRIAYPTEHLKYKLTFPLDFDPTDYDYDVWLGEGRVQHMDEYRRVHNFWRVGRNDDGKMFIELSIKHPIHGLIYALKWIPPREELIAKPE